MPQAPDLKRESILSAALVQFGQYGFRRTSMEDIARETGVSRASLYSYFENKEEIFRCVASGLQERSLADAEGHLKGAEVEHADLTSRVSAALMARIRPFHEILAQSAHGAEIQDENNRLCGDLVLESSQRFRKMLATAIGAAARAGEIDLKPVGLTAPAAAELILLATTGLKQGAADEATVERRVQSFVDVFVAGLRD